jgi:hypothetical protein
MARPFVGSVADVLARTRRTICKNPRNAALALRRSHCCFRTPSAVYGDGHLELRRQTRNPGIGWPQEANHKRLALFSPDYADRLYFRLASAALCWRRDLLPYTSEL